MKNTGGIVAVIGDVMLDVYINGDATRLSPEAPVPVVNVSNRTHTLGGAGNVALNLANLGRNVHLFGVRGNDVAGTTVSEILHKHKITSALYIDKLLPTTTKTRVIANNQQLVRFDDERLNGTVCHRYLRSALSEVIHAACIVVISDYGKGVLRQDFINFIIESARYNGIPILVDPKRSDWEPYRGATIITPNIPEIEIAIGHRCEEDADVLDAAETLMKEYQFQSIVVTRGAKGMLVVKRDSHLFLPTVAKSVFDVSGAGDTVIATMATCLCSGRDIIESAQIANIAAGIVVGKLGTSPIELFELNQILAGTEHGQC